MPATAMNHFTVLTDDVAGTVRFYADVLGLSDGPRPPFEMPGAWLYSRGVPVLHVVGGRPRSELRPGVIDHIAFTAEGLAGTLATLASRAIPASGGWGSARGRCSSTIPTAPASSSTSPPTSRPGPPAARDRLTSRRAALPEALCAQSGACSHLVREGGSAQRAGGVAPTAS